MGIYQDAISTPLVARKEKLMPEDADFLLTEHGTTYLLRPQTSGGRAWIEANVSREDSQPMWPTVAIEHRYIEAILNGIRATGNLSWDYVKCSGLCLEGAPGWTTPVGAAEALERILFDVVQSDVSSQEPEAPTEDQVRVTADWVERLMSDAVPLARRIEALSQPGMMPVMMALRLRVVHDLTKQLLAVMTRPSIS